jgi:hypothetical protein
MHGSGTIALLAAALAEIVRREKLLAILCA